MVWYANIESNRIECLVDSTGVREDTQLLEIRVEVGVSKPQIFTNLDKCFVVDNSMNTLCGVFVSHHIHRLQTRRTMCCSAVGAAHFHLGVNKGMSALVAGMHIGGSIIVHADMVQVLAAFGAAQLVIINICAFGRNIRTSEVVQHRFLVDIRTLAFRATFRVNQVTTLALRTEMYALHKVLRFSIAQIQQFLIKLQKLLA